jgi:hypothetical protein
MMITTGKHDRIGIIILLSVTGVFLALNFIFHARPAAIVLSIVGAASYSVLVRLGAYDTRIPFDYIQTGEAGVGSAAILLALLVFPDSLPAVVIILLLSLVFYGVFLNIAIAPDKVEMAVAGAIIMALITAIMLFLFDNGVLAKTAVLSRVLTGYARMLPSAVLLAIGALALGAAVRILSSALDPELRSFSLGAGFYFGSEASYILIILAMTLVRGALLSSAVLFSGTACGIGFSLSRLYRGSLPEPVLFLSLASFGQIILLISERCGPLWAVLASIAFSYIVFGIYFIKRTYVYDRGQES